MSDPTLGEGISGIERCITFPTFSVTCLTYLQNSKGVFQTSDELSVSVPTVRDEYFTSGVLCTADLGLVVPKLRCDILGRVLWGLSLWVTSSAKGKSLQWYSCRCFHFSRLFLVCWHQDLNRTTYCVDVPSENVLGSVAPVWFGGDLFLLGYKTYCVCHRYKSIKNQISVSLHNLSL